jgi:hypothetical protein
MIHQVCAVTFDLLVGRDGAKDNFGELAAFERAIGDPTTGRISTDNTVARIVPTQQLPWAS